VEEASRAARYSVGLTWGLKYGVTWTLELRSGINFGASHFPLLSPSQYLFLFLIFCFRSVYDFLFIFFLS